MVPLGCNQPYLKKIFKDLSMSYTVYTMASEEEKVYKTPVYVRNAKRNYHNRRIQNDPEYAQRIRDQQRMRHAKRREQDPEFKERYEQNNKEASTKKTLEYLHSFVNGEPLVMLIDQFYEAVNMSGAPKQYILAEVKQTLTFSIDGEPLYLYLRRDHNKRRIKNIAIAAIFYVMSKKMNNLRLKAFVDCYGVSYATLSEIVSDIKVLISNHQ